MNMHQLVKVVIFIAMMIHTSNEKILPGEENKMEF